MKLKLNLIKAMYSMLMVIAAAAVNTTCHYHFYQEKLSPKLDSLKKYYEE